MLCGPFSPGAIESDSVRVGGSALGRASARERPAVRVLGGALGLLSAPVQAFRAGVNTLGGLRLR
jgi:hypothetical protein